ncbi:MAG: UxaA family hydrolase [Firmicutes bacterium]|nr:UxaA family hydrolase [Bacillota bacterium]
MELRGTRDVFWGYRRPNGSVGVRNHVLVMASAVCANDTVRRIAAAVPGVVPLTHQHGCAQLGADAEQTRRTLVGFGSNPNVAAVLVVGLGCETGRAEVLAEEIAKTGKPVELIIIQKAGGTVKAAEAGVVVASRFVRETSEARREECGVHELILALECGASDASSGVSANPATGVATDLLVAAGGTAILSETSELIGAEHLLAKRCASPKVAERLLHIVRRMEQEAMRMGVDIRGANPTPGNIEGGLTTIEEKSLGCIYKAGTTQIMEVLDYAERPTSRGLVVMDTPGQDIESITGMVAGGAQICVFTTGLGAVTGCPIAPVIKVCGNTATFDRMRDNLDLNAGTIVDGLMTVPEVGEQIYREVIEVSSGRLTRAESLGCADFAITRIGHTM